MDNREVQAAHFDKVYAKADEWVARVTAADRFRTEFERFRRQNVLSYGSFYFDHLERRLTGQRVLELGFGRGDHSLFMARFGAKVLGIEVSKSAVDNLRTLVAVMGLEDRVRPVHCPDLARLQAEPKSFDLVVGKAFLHHLTHEEEDRCLDAVARLLAPAGEARFFEPACNSLTLDRLRWMTPVRGRPSILQRRAFAEWKARDPHPDRDDSSGHFLGLATRYFEVVEIVPKEALQRLARFARKNSVLYRRIVQLMQQIEPVMPRSIHLRVARAQVIICKRPRPRPQDDSASDPYWGHSSSLT